MAGAVLVLLVIICSSHSNINVLGMKSIGFNDLLLLSL